MSNTSVSVSKPSGIMWFPGCEPDNPNRPKAEVTPMLRKDVVLTRLGKVYADLVSEVDGVEQQKILLLFYDILVAINCASHEDTQAVFGDDGVWFLDNILAEHAVKITPPEDSYTV